MATLVSGAALAKGKTPPPHPRTSAVSSSSPSEPVSHVFPRTPAFAWAPSAARSATSSSCVDLTPFGESSIVWSNVRYGVKPGTGCAAVDRPALRQARARRGLTASGTGTGTTGADRSHRCDRRGRPRAARRHDTGCGAGRRPGRPTTIQPLRVPAVSVDVSLPWFTGQPYALYAHVRAITTQRPDPAGAAVRLQHAVAERADAAPEPSPASCAGSPSAGATSYQVWYPESTRCSPRTRTSPTCASSTPALHMSWYSTVNWRVRAVRRVFGNVPNGLPAVSYGPWSPTYTATNPASTTGQAHARRLRCPTRSATARSRLARAHARPRRSRQPSASTGQVRIPSFASTSRPTRLREHRLSRAAHRQPRLRTAHHRPARAPGRRLGRHQAQAGWLPDGANEGAATLRVADGFPVSTSEASQPTATAANSTAERASRRRRAGAHVDLPDIDFPTTRYYWTVVPVKCRRRSRTGRTSTSTSMCRRTPAPRAGSRAFGKDSDPVQRSPPPPRTSPA